MQVYFKNLCKLSVIILCCLCCNILLTKWLSVISSGHQADRLFQSWSWCIYVWMFVCDHLKKPKTNPFVIRYFIVTFTVEFPFCFIMICICASGGILSAVLCDDVWQNWAPLRDEVADAQICWFVFLYLCEHLWLIRHRFLRGCEWVDACVACQRCRILTL